MVRVNKSLQMAKPILDNGKKEKNMVSEFTMNRRMEGITWEGCKMIKKVVMEFYQGLIIK